MAVVDLGSNAVRFLLAEVKPNAGYRVLVEERARTRLGAGAPGTLPRAAIDDTLRAVHRFFAHHVPNGGGPRIVAVDRCVETERRGLDRSLALDDLPVQRAQEQAGSRDLRPEIAFRIDEE